MRRAVIFATLTMLLLAVAGVTAAQEGVFDGTPAGDSTEATNLEGTEPERTVPETTFAADEGTVMEEEPPAGDEKRDEPAGSPERPGGQGRYDDGPAEPEPVEADEGRGSGGGGPGNGRPEDAGKRGNGRGPDLADKGGEKGNNGGGGEEKVSVCHKGKKTLSVGASAEDAHLRHGDEAGRCE